MNRTFPALTVARLLTYAGGRRCPCRRLTAPGTAPSALRGTRLGRYGIAMLLFFGSLCLSWGAPSNSVTHTSAPAITNAPPSVTTNLPPATTNAAAVLPPKSPSALNGALLVDAFGRTLSDGKFCISGRALKLPVPPCETNASPPDAWRRSINCGMTMTRGNSETLRYSLGVDAIKERADDLFRFRAQGFYGKSGDKTDTENALAALRHEHRMTEATYALGNVEWTADTIADLDYRVTSILSPGIHLVRTRLALLNVELGAGYLAERKGSNEEGYATGRLAMTFERILNEHVLTWITAEYLPKITDAHVFYVNSEAGVVTALSRSLSLNITLQDRYDNAPVEAKHNHDAVLTTSLSLNF